MIYLHGVTFVNNFVNLPFAFNTTLPEKKKEKKTEKQSGHTQKKYETKGKENKQITY